MLDAVVTQLLAHLQLLALEDQPEVLALEALLLSKLGAAGLDGVRGREVIDRDGRAGKTTDEDLRVARAGGVSGLRLLWAAVRTSGAASGRRALIACMAPSTAICTQ